MSQDSCCKPVPSVCPRIHALVQPDKEYLEVVYSSYLSATLKTLTPGKKN